MKSSLALLCVTTTILTGALTVSVPSGASEVTKPVSPGVLYQRFINDKNEGIPSPPVEVENDRNSINVSAIPARYIYVQFPGEESRIITLRDLDTAINERAIQNVVK
jgi:hypothetical protein